MRNGWILGVALLTGAAPPVSLPSSKLLRDVPEARVLCVYQRGAAQKSWGFQPARGDVIHVFLEPFTPSSEHEGLRAARDYSEQIILHLQAMEERFFRDRET